MCSGVSVCSGISTNALIKVNVAGADLGFFKGGGASNLQRGLFVIILPDFSENYQ